MNERILENFLSLTRIPRKSHHEEAVSRFLYEWAQEKGLVSHRDEVGNVIIDRPASAGCENKPRTILQAHMDMVCVAEQGRKYDPLTDPIQVINDGVTLTADGTSLGGDDGAGVAIAMDIVEDQDAVFGPVRAIFTVDEEDGMLGADKLSPEYLDADYLVNLDWEAFGSLCCSSAGSDMYELRRNVLWEETGECIAYALDIQGLEGGHSGAQIHLGRANAIRMAARILSAGAEACGGIRLAVFRGGSAHNAIPSACFAVAVTQPGKGEAFLEAVRRAVDTELEGCALTDPGALITVTETEAPAAAISAVDSADILGILCAVHDGVNTWSASIPGLVESSANTGLAHLEGDGFTFMIHQRSSEPALTARMKDVYLAQAAQFGFAMDVLTSSPAWPVRPGSELLEICARQFRTLTGNEIRVEPVHAGLECGGFSQKNPALDIISIGPDILDIHSPKETLVLQSVYDCSRLVRGILKEIAEK